MKLLFDENISRRLVESLRVEFPGSAHVKDFGLQSADDETIWNFAKKDSDFHQRCFLLGPPAQGDLDWMREFLDAHDRRDT